MLIGCSDNNSSSSNKSVIDPQIQALEKAKAVEQRLLDSANKQREKIDSYE